jgi:hypothetical protein
MQNYRSAVLRPKNCVEPWPIYWRHPKFNATQKVDESDENAGTFDDRQSLRVVSIRSRTASIMRQLGAPLTAGDRITSEAFMGSTQPLLFSPTFPAQRR